MEGLLDSARRASYFDLSMPELDALYRRSGSVVNRGYRSMSESDWFALVEQHFYLCILTCNDNEAKLMLQRIVDKFTFESPRVQTLHSIYVRSTQGPQKFEEHASTEGEIHINTKKIASVKLKALGKWPEYVEELVRLSELNPVDPEIWAELGEAYANLGAYTEAIKAWELVVVINAYYYNAFARIGELYHLRAALMKDGADRAFSDIIDALKNMCRSVELCPTYIRGWCGVYVVASKLVELPRSAGEQRYVNLRAKAKKVLGQALEEEWGIAQDREAARKLLS